MDRAEYHVRREAEERRCAEQARSDAIRDIHRELADRHADKAWSIRESCGDAG
jgi:hypothetical protein